MRFLCDTFVLMSRHVRAERLTRSCRGIFVSSFAVLELRSWESVEVCLEGKVWRLLIF